MKAFFPAPRLALAVLSASLLAAGCDGFGNGAVNVTGRLTKEGKPYQAKIREANLPPGADVGKAEVHFYRVQSETEPLVNQDGKPVPHEMYAAVVAEDGSFEVPGAQGRGIPPGKYRIVVKHLHPRSRQDLLRGAFNERNSKLTRDVVEDTGEIVIDLSKPNG